MYKLLVCMACRNGAQRVRSPFMYCHDSSCSVLTAIARCTCADSNQGFIDAHKLHIELERRYVKLLNDKSLAGQCL